MIARTDIADAPRPSRHPSEALADALMKILRGAHGVALDVGWSLWRGYQVRQTTRPLTDMPDHMLRDIGLTRADLMSVTVRRVRAEEAFRRWGDW